MAHSYASIYDRLESQPDLQEIIRDHYYDSFELEKKNKRNYNALVYEFEKDCIDYTEAFIEAFYDENPRLAWVNDYIEGDLVTEDMIEDILCETSDKRYFSSLHKYWLSSGI